MFICQLWILDIFLHEAESSDNNDFVSLVLHWELYIISLIFTALQGR